MKLKDVEYANDLAEARKRALKAVATLDDWTDVSLGSEEKTILLPRSILADALKHIADRCMAELTRLGVEDSA